MRILFIHASRDSTPEYNVHRLLAEHVDPSDNIECYFIWQDCTHDRSLNRPACLGRPNRNLYWDFGRNMSLSPQPSRARRAMMMLSRLPGSLLFLVKKVREIKPDVIYTSQQSYEVNLASILCLLFSVPHLIHMNYVVGPWLGRSTLQIIRKTPHLLACSEFIRQGAIEMGIAPQHVDTVHNVANVQRFDVPKNREAVRQAFNMPADTPLVVAAGRLDPGKGYMLLLKAFARVHRDLPHAHLLICGETTTRNHYDAVLKNKVMQLHLDHCVTFAGGRRDLPMIFGGADLFCLATENEPFGLVFTEAMLAGLPVVACVSGAVPEIVRDGETGLLSKPGDADALAANLVRLLRDPELSTQMAIAGKRRALTDFAPDKAAATWARLLHKQFGDERVHEREVNKEAWRSLEGKG